MARSAILCFVLASTGCSTDPDVEALQAFCDDLDRDGDGFYVRVVADRCYCLAEVCSATSGGLGQPAVPESCDDVPAAFHDLVARCRES